MLGKLKREQYEALLEPLEAGAGVHGALGSETGSACWWCSRAATPPVRAARSTRSPTPQSAPVPVVALPKPTEDERTQWYFQRYAAHLPAAGEIVLFDRSWYNRAGVEKVMGFATDQQVEEFLKAPRSSRCWSTTASCSSSTGWAATRNSRKNASPSASTTR